MSQLRRIQELLEKGDFENIELEWLTRLEEDPSDIPFFAGAARGLSGQAQLARANNLLEMLDAQLRERAAWAPRLDLLRRVGPMLEAEPEKLHVRILGTLDRLYGMRPSYSGFVETLGLKRAPNDIPKTWEKVEKLLELVVFEIGEIVFMEGKGAGRVAEVNQALQSFRIDFEGFPKLSVGFKAAPKLLKRLKEDHVLHRKLVEPETLRQLAESDPSELLRIVLSSYTQALSAADVKRDLGGIVAESRWTSWWSTARKHPQVVASSAGRQTYGWAASSEHAVSSVWATFQKADPRKKIDLLRRDGARDLALREKMGIDLAELAANSRNGGLALEIWFALEKFGLAPAEGPWSPSTVLAAKEDPRPAISGIEDRGLRERCYAWVKELRIDWVQVYQGALTREDDSRTLELLSTALAESAPAELDRFITATLSSPQKMPGAFVWLAEKAAQEESLRAKSPLRLLQQLVSSLAANEFAPFKSRLLALLQSGGTVPRLLPHLSEEQALQAEEAIDRAPGLEAYHREDLVRALHMRFPALKKEEVAPLYALPASIAEKQAELHRISTKEIPANRKAIEEARAMGDLRENFEYKSARQRHEYLTARATELNEQLNRSRPVDLATVDTSEVRVGTRVRLVGDDGEQRELSILGPWESDPDGGVISYESELGKALLGARPSNAVTVSGKTYTVEAINTYAP